MTEDKNKFEYSEPREHKKEVDRAIQEIEAAIKENQALIEELKKEHEDTLESNKFAKEEGFRELDINEIEDAIREHELMAVSFGELKEKLLNQSVDFEELDHKIKELLLKTKGPEI